jgi:hypothetical protein
MGRCAIQIVMVSQMPDLLLASSLLQLYLQILCTVLLNETGPGRVGQVNLLPSHSRALCHIE